MDDGFNFEFEATRLVEKTMLNDDNMLLPVTGKDVIESLGVEPGLEVGGLLEEARRYYSATRCSRDKLLDHLGKFRRNGL